MLTQKMSERRLALLMDLSKAFDTINHELLIAKLHAYGFSTDALEVLLSNLQDKWHIVKINTTFIIWTQLLKEFHNDQFLVLSYLMSWHIQLCR